MASIIICLSLDAMEESANPRGGASQRLLASAQSFKENAEKLRKQQEEAAPTDQTLEKISAWFSQTADQVDTLLGNLLNMGQEKRRDNETTLMQSLENDLTQIRNNGQKITEWFVSLKQRQQVSEHSRREVRKALGEQRTQIASALDKATQIRRHDIAVQLGNMAQNITALIAQIDPSNLRAASDSIPNPLFEHPQERAHNASDLKYNSAQIDQAKKEIRLQKATLIGAKCRTFYLWGIGAITGAGVSAIAAASAKVGIIPSETIGPKSYVILSGGFLAAAGYCRYKNHQKLAELRRVCAQPVTTCEAVQHLEQSAK